MPQRATISPPTRGQVAERLVVERLRAVVGPEILVLDTVTWLLRERGAMRNGEADVVIGDPGPASVITIDVSVLVAAGAPDDPAAIYVATAVRSDAALITLDDELLTRTSPLVDAVTPTEWLERRR